MNDKIVLIFLSALFLIIGLVLGIIFGGTIVPTIYTKDIPQVAAIIANIAVVISVLFLGIQTRELTAQSKLANDVARVDANREASLAVDGVLKIFIDHPALRPYFYSNKPLPKEPIIRLKVNALAELLTDSVAVALRTATKLKFSDPDLLCWKDYSKFLYNNSPAIRNLLASEPACNPEILAILDIRLPKRDKPHTMSKTTRSLRR